MTIVKVNPWYKWFALVLQRNKSSLLSQHWGTKMAQLHCLSAVRPPSKGTNCLLLSPPTSFSPSDICMQGFPETEYGTQSDKVSRCCSSDRNIGDECMLRLNSYHCTVSTLCSKISCWLMLEERNRSCRVHTKSIVGKLWHLLTWKQIRFLYIFGGNAQPIKQMSELFWSQVWVDYRVCYFHKHFSKSRKPASWKSAEMQNVKDLSSENRNAGS